MATCDTNGEFTNKVILVTGGSKGIGKAICNVLIENSCKIAIADIDSMEGNLVTTELNTRYGRNSSLFIRCDVSSYTQLQNAFEKTVEMYGKIDVVINNAGIFNEHQWKETVNVNMLGTINGTLLGLQFMGKDKGNRGGSIINISSNAALVPFPLAPVYAATKCGILGLTRSYGHPLHFERTGVAVCALCPYAVNTDLNVNFCENSSLPDVAKKHMENIAMLKPIDVAQAVIKLLEDNKSGSVMEVSVNGDKYVK